MENDLVILSVLAIAFIIALVVLTIGLHLVAKAQEMAVRYGAVISIKMQDSDYSRLIQRFASTVANSDEAATMCVLMAKAMEDANSNKADEFAAVFKRIMGHEDWYLIYEPDTAKRLAVELLKTTQIDRRVVK